MRVKNNGIMFPMASKNSVSDGGHVPSATDNARGPDEQSFIRGVMARGEAGYRIADGTLPLPFKFAISGIHTDGLPILERVRM